MNIAVNKIALPIILTTLFFHFYCSNKKDPEQVVVARIGNRTITAKQFRSNYEFGLPHLKQGPDRKLSYLNYMIMEEVLSQDGFKHGLDRTERVQKLEKDLLDELLVEELFQTEIKDEIKISPDQIRDAITKSNVKWKLRYWVEPDELYANRIAAAMKEQGYSRVLEDILTRNPEINLNPKDFETQYLSWLDVSEDVLDVIKNVAVGDISNPIEIDGKYFIFQVLDIRT